MELAIRNNEKTGKRKCTTLVQTKGKALQLFEAPPRAIGEDGHFYECMKCNEVGSLICCDTCSCTYHCGCLNPPLKSIPDGDWFCPNCPDPDDDESGSSGKRHRSVRRARKFSSRCRLCSNIKKILISDENEFFISKSNSTGQPKFAIKYRGEPSARKDRINRSIIQQNTNEERDKLLILRDVLQRLVDEQYSRKQTNHEVEDSMNQLVPIDDQTGQVQNDENVHLHRASPKGKQIVEKTTKTRPDPRPKGRPKGKQIVNKTSKRPRRSGSKQDVQNQNPDLSMVKYGENVQPNASANTTDAQKKVDADGWSGLELDALWVGVRRHGPGNWETILTDTSLGILKIHMKSPRDLSMKWVKELQIIYSFPKPPSLVLPSSVPEETPQATAQQLLPPANIPAVTSPESGALVPSDHQASSSSTVDPAPPHWTPDLNLDPMANQIAFETHQRNANPETQMRDIGVQANPTPGAAMATQRPSANSTAVPSLFIGGRFFPIPYAYRGGGPNCTVRNPF